MVDILLLLAGVIGIIVSAIYTFKNKISFFKGICYASLSWLASFVLSVAYQKSMFAMSPIDFVIDFTFSQLKAVVSELPQEIISAFSGGESVEVFKATLLSELENVRNTYVMLYPAIIIITYTVLIFILFMIIKNVLRLFKKDMSFIPRFNEIELKKSTLFGYLFSMLMAYVMSDTVTGNVFANIQLLYSAYVILCGISLIDYFLARRIKIGPVRLVLYTGLVLFSGGLVAVVIQVAAFAAVLDAFKHFRADKSKWV